MKYFLILFAFLIQFKAIAHDEVAAQIEEIVRAYQDSFQSMWQESMGDNPRKKKYEIFALLVENPDGEFKMRNYIRSDSTSGVSTDYSHTPEQRLIGQVHTHPQTVFSQYSELDQLPPSAADVMEFYNRKNYGAMEMGAVSIILTSAKIYALVIEDPEKAMAHFKKLEEIGRSQGMSLRDYTNKLYSRTNRGNDIPEIQRNSTMAITGQVLESGIGFYMTEGKSKQVFRRVN